MQQVQYQLPQNCSQQPILEQQAMNLLPNIEIDTFKMEPQFTYDHFNQPQFTTYKGMSSFYAPIHVFMKFVFVSVVGVPVSADLLFKTPILEGEDDIMTTDDSEIVVDV